jgi:LmbE family N-acetylglucosaminyl deacetylase
MPVAEEDIERILVVTAHPDDLDFGVAGSVAVWTDKGIEVSYCIVTDGDAGGFDPDVPRSEIAGIRRAEQTAAAEQVGVTDLSFLGHPDGRLYPTIELRRDISRVIRRVRPQRVVTQSPDRNYKRIYASHPDHMAAGEAALCAVYPDARIPSCSTRATRRGPWRRCGSCRPGPAMPSRTSRRPSSARSRHCSATSVR